MLTHSWCRMFRFAILNDFEAVGYGIPAVAETDVVVLNDAPIVPNVCPPSASLCHCSALVLLWDIQALCRPAYQSLQAPSSIGWLLSGRLE